MTLASGTRLGPYEIVAPLGAGGMGEVYRARDTRLERTVAIKVLPPHLSSSGDLRERFEREAKAISSLNYAHICTLHDIGRHDGIDFLVIEYLEGETLAARLAKGPLPVDQVLRYAIQIAEALDRAHRQGIVHRDLKPGNVMLTKGGAKLLDFGLAKYRPPGAVPAISSAFTAMPTEARPLTAEGSIVGTFQYMAPEQLEGKEPDARTDIFAFGALLYEMATARKAFTGKSQASLIAAILASEPPPISTLQPLSPPALDRVVRTCLAKDPDERWQNAHDLVNELRWIQEAGSQAGVPAVVVARRKTREGLAWAAAVMAAVTASLFAYLWREATREPPRTVQASIDAPAKTTYNFDLGPMALSPDGRRLAFVARNSEGRSFLWVRPLNALSAQALGGTEEASYPFWSPDGKFLGFFAGGKLKKIDVSGGPPQTLCDAPGGRGGTWNRQGVIVFSPSPREPLHRVSSAGGTSTPVTELDAAQGETSHRLPAFLPDGRYFFYVTLVAGRSERRGIHLASLDSKGSTRILPVSSSVAYAAPGYVLFARERTLMAQGFDLEKRQLTGEAFPVAEAVSYYPNFGMAMFSVSENGILAYHGGGLGGLAQLDWFDRSGKLLETIGPPGDYMRPHLSHDGRRLAVDIRDAQTGNRDIWIYELARRVATRFTFDPTQDANPVWSPDDSRIAFSAARKSPGDIYVKVASGAGSDEPLFTADDLKVPIHWSADGRFILFLRSEPRSKTGNDIWVLDLADKKASVVLQTDFAEFPGALSPDGRWMAYSSDESGTGQVYVQPFPGPGGKWQVSTGGGSALAWRRDGKEIFYIAPDRKLMAVPVTTGATFETGVPEALFETRLVPAPGRHYDVSADGKRFILSSIAGEPMSAPITLVLNWAAELKR